MRTRTWMLAVLVATASPPVMAQTPVVSPPPADTRAIAKVTVDLAAGAFDRGLPFDVPFFITGRAPEGTVNLEVQYAVVPTSGDVSNLVWMPGEAFRWTPDRPTVGDQPFLVLVRTPLEARTRYQLRFMFRRDGASASTTLTAEGRTAQMNYVSLDLGVAYAGTIGIGALYVGTNIYFRPVNKNAPLGEFDDFGRRLAFTAGVTLSPVADENNQTRSDLFWHQSLVLGGGYRLTSSIRGGGGALVFREANPNPLITRKSAATTWYVSFSYDLNVLRW